MSQLDQKHLKSLKSSPPSGGYKALISDIDGTLLSKTIGRVPSEKVTLAIQKAQSTIHVGLATARPLFMIENIINHIKLQGPSIINGGAQVIDVRTKKTIWEQIIDSTDLKKIFTILKNQNVSFFINDDGKDIEPSKNYAPYKPYSVTIRGSKALVDLVLEKLSIIPTISTHKFVWQGENDLGISINHINATKQHAVLEVARTLNIDTHEIIGVGDSYNDFPLLMACGLKVAMGNANDELKAIADYIAPSVDEDGVADVIEKFILNDH